MDYCKNSGEIFKYSAKIKLLIMDVDGVLTDGSVYVDNKGNELLRFSRIDGKGLELLRQKNILTGAISQENNDAARYRMKKLKINFVSLGIKNKINVYNRWKKSLKLDDTQICVCGDDLADLQILNQAGFSCAPKNAQDEVKSVVDYVSVFKGGEGFIRDVCNIILNKKDMENE